MSGATPKTEPPPPPPLLLSSADARLAARELLVWYDRHRRDLPWRQNRDPYRVWLSEVMLQQTRVETVLPYYQRFLERFPTIEDLAAAEVEEVLALWSGLGYYRRARQLHSAAREVAARGSFPATQEGLLELPGIGAYTAAAVGSIAFGLVEPVMDGNVERVISRLLASEGDPKKAKTRRRLLEQAAALLDEERPGDSNQALMELGATLCTPRTPRCLLCPLSSVCRATAEGEPERYPPPRNRRAVEQERRAAVVVQDGGRTLLFERPDDAELLAGTWELPWLSLDGGATTPPDPSAPALAEGLVDRYGGQWQLSSHLGTVRHGITHRAIRVEVYRGDLNPQSAETLADGPRAGFFDAAERRTIPTSSLVDKILQLVEREPREGEGDEGRPDDPTADL